MFLKAAGAAKSHLTAQKTLRGAFEFVVVLSPEALKAPVKFTHFGAVLRLSGALGRVFGALFFGALFPRQQLEVERFNMRAKSDAVSGS